MKTIEEIMSLVDEYEKARVIETAFMGDEKSEEKRSAIESALRELVERKPLEDCVMWDVVCQRIDANEFTATELNEMFEIGRNVEKSHGIGA